MCCLVNFQDLLVSAEASVFLSEVTFLDVFAILAFTIAYRNLGKYIIEPIATAVIAAKNTAPAAISLIKPILS